MNAPPLHRPFRAVSIICLIMCAVTAVGSNSVGAPMPQSKDIAIAQVRGEVYAAYATARAWLDALEPPSDNAAESLVKLPADCAGVCAIVRSRGKPLGVATALAKDGEASTGPTLALRRALGRAISQTLGDPSVAGLPNDLRDGIGPQLALELEFAGPLIPLVGRSLDRLAEGVTPGFDGLAVRFRDRVHALFPTQMRVMGMADDPRAALQALAIEAGLSLGDLKTIGSRGDVSVYHFATTHLAALQPASDPVELSHGDVIVPIEAVTPEALGQFASNLALHLMNHRWPGEEQVGLMGDYNPVADRYEPLIAPPLDQALCAWSLARFARAKAGAADVAMRARGEAANILARLQTVEAIEADPLTSPAVCGAMLLAAIELGYHVEAVESNVELRVPIDLNTTGTAGEGDVLSRAREVVFAAAAQIALRSDAAEPGAQRSPRSSAHDLATLAMLALTVKRLHEAGDPNATEALAQDVAAAAMRSVPPSQQISLMPFLAYACAPAHAKRDAHGAQADDASSPRAQFGELFDALLQVMHAPQTPEVHSGGFVLATAQAARRIALPDAQSVRPAAFIAACCASASERSERDQQALRAAMRFLMQLQVREELRAIQPGYARAAGGLRSSLATMRQPLPAQALALLAAVDAIQALARSDAALDPLVPPAAPSPAAP